jgi:hypothetical protein
MLVMLKLGAKNNIPPFISLCPVRGEFIPARRAADNRF